MQIKSCFKKKVSCTEIICLPALFANPAILFPIISIQFDYNIKKQLITKFKKKFDIKKSGNNYHSTQTDTQLQNSPEANVLVNSYIELIIRYLTAVI